MSEPTEEEIEALMSAVLSQHSAPPPYISPVIQDLPDTDRPQVSPACETCPASLWFKTPDQLKCFCTRMHATTWYTDMKEPPVMQCDGRELALLALDLAKSE